MRTSSPRKTFPPRERPGLWLALALLVLLAAGARASASAFVQRAHGKVSAGPSVEAGFKRANSDGALIVAYVVWDNGDPVSLTDTQGNTYQSAGDAAQGAPGSAQVFFARNVHGGRNSVTATFASAIANHAALYVHEYARMSRSAPFDVSVTAVGQSADVETALITPHTSGDMLFLAVTSDGKSIKHRTRGLKSRVKDGGTLTADTFPDGASYQAVATQSGTGWIAQLVSFHYVGDVPKSSAKFPLVVGPTGRYLADQAGTAFLLTGDSPQALVVGVTLSDQAKFLSDRQARGFNAVWVNLLCAEATGGRPDGSTFDGVLPFEQNLATLTPDLTTPNEAYFMRVDALVRLAAERGLLLIFDPAETISYGRVLKANGAENAQAFGVYLGMRYRGFDNVIWMSGNDFRTVPGSADDQIVQALASGIRSQAPLQLQTVELNPRVSNSIDDPTWSPLIDFNASYTIAPTYPEILAAYNHAGPLPTFMVEANYEGENLAVGDQTERVLRSQVYWALLSGAMGHLYGNKFTWQFLPDWQSHYKTAAASQMGFAREMFEERSWWELVPDQGHALVTAGLGTFSTQESADNDYVTAARTPDGKLGVAYVPSGQTITVDFSQMSGRAKASWFDPAGNRFVKVKGSPFDNAGSVELTPPGRNRGGDPDWVLVLEAN